MGRRGGGIGIKKGGARREKGQARKGMMVGGTRGVNVGEGQQKRARNYNTQGLKRLSCRNDGDCFTIE